MRLFENASIETITYAVDNIRHKLNIKLTDYPINLFDALSKYPKIRVYEKELNYSVIGGFLLNKAWLDYAVIIINSNNSYEDKNFALAHELVHYFCHNADSIMSSSNFTQHRNPKEKQANEGAAELLVPAALFENEIKTALSFYEDQTTAFSETAKAYHVAPEVIKYRFFNLGLDK